MKFYILSIAILAILFASPVSAVDSSSVIKDEHFLNLAGFIKKGLVIKRRVNLNQDHKRSPDPREFLSPMNAFEVNYKLFLNDNEYKCRRPTFYSYFKEKFNQDPFSQVECPHENKISMISEKLTTNPITLKSINVDRIYQIHYLFAGKGKEMMSKFGHAMYRLVICAPTTKFGPDCLNDYKEHIVLSFRANVKDPTLDYKKGIDGSYSSELFIMNMHEVIDEYTKGEFRDVISLPLNLRLEEIKRFTFRFLEIFWSYKGKYYFFTNNCASEALNLLKTAAIENVKVQKLEVTTPLELFNKLADLNLINLNLLNNKKEAIRNGHLFEGVSTKLKNSLLYFVKDSNLTFDQFVEKYDAKERLTIYQNAITISSDKTTILANALRTEEQISQHQEQIFAKKIGEALFGKNKIPELEDSIIKDKIEETRTLYNQIASINTKTIGYGIPFHNEIAMITEVEFNSAVEQINRSSEELKELAFKFFPSEVNEMRETYNNRAYLMTEISQIN